jgi:hypothetical protein
MKDDINKIVERSIKKLPRKSSKPKPPRNFLCGICKKPVKGGGHLSGILGFGWCCERCNKVVLRPALKHFQEIVRTREHLSWEQFNAVMDMFRKTVAIGVRKRLAERETAQ